jgi:hypothetical protein
MTEPVCFCFDRGRGTALRRMPKAANRVNEVVLRRISIHETPPNIFSEISDLVSDPPGNRAGGSFFCVKETQQ